MTTTKDFKYKRMKKKWRRGNNKGDFLIRKLFFKLLYLPHSHTHSLSLFLSLHTRTYTHIYTHSLSFSTITHSLFFFISLYAQAISLYNKYRHTLSHTLSLSLTHTHLLSFSTITHTLSVSSSECKLNPINILYGFF